jgi:hypothetical protein
MSMFPIFILCNRVRVILEITGRRYSICRMFPGAFGSYALFIGVAKLGLCFSLHGCQESNIKVVKFIDCNHAV